MQQSICKMYPVLQNVSSSNNNNSDLPMSLLTHVNVM